MLLLCCAAAAGELANTGHLAVSHTHRKLLCQGQQGVPVSGEIGHSADLRGTAQETHINGDSSDAK